MAKNKKRADGRYALQFRFEGKKYAVYSIDRNKLEELKAQKLEELRTGKLDHDNPTLEDFYHGIFSDRRAERAKESTVRAQNFHFQSVGSIEVQKGVKLAKMRIKDITPADMLTVQKALKDSGKMKTRTVNDRMSFLRHVFNEAVRLDIIDKNPTRQVIALKITDIPARESIHRALTPEEVSLFLDGAKERHSYYLPLFIFMLNTGVRVGEAAGLTEDEISGDHCYIVRTVARSVTGAYYFQEPKTNAGKREIPLNVAAREALNTQRKHILMLGIKRKLYKGENESITPSKPTIFCSPNGDLLRDYTADREIQRICKAKGIARFSSHALRDSFATFYNEQYPERWKDLQTILGHANAKYTTDIYIHSTERGRDESMMNFSVS